MEFKSPPTRLARLFRRSRDLWKERAADKQHTIKRLRITVRDLTQSRDHWRARAQQLQQQVRTLTSPRPARTPTEGSGLGG